ncbi:MAG: bifunctional DNA primase/polymerase [Planctomycetota bacterium]
MGKAGKSENGLLKYALSYYQRGWSIIPVPHGSKKARIRWGKYQHTRPGEEQFRRWFSKGKYNIAVILGAVSGDLACRDFDSMDEYHLWVSKYPDLAKLLPTVQTAKGMHVYFEGHIQGIKHIANGELRGSGGYCLLPPSVHPDGPEYQWANPLLNGNLLAIDPKLAGFITDVTERTDENGGELKEIVVCRSIEEAIKYTLPAEIHTRHRKIFDFGRELKSMPEYSEADPKEFRSIVKEWHKRALPKIQTKEFEETWIDFLKAWAKIKWKIGESPMAQIFEKAIQLEPSEIAVEKYPEHAKLKILASLCRELQRAAGRNPFFLRVRTGASLLSVTPMTISRWLFLLESDGILRTVEKGGTRENPRKATLFRYIAD